LADFLMRLKLIVCDAYMISTKYKTHAVTKEMKLPMKVNATQLEMCNLPGAMLTEKKSSITVKAIRTAHKTKNAVAMLMMRFL